MEKVFFTPAEVSVTDPSKWYQPEQSLVARLERVIEESRILDGISEGDVVAVKTHFGDRGTTKMLRSLFIRKIVEMAKEKGAKVFVTETTGLGLLKDRCTAIGRLEIAEENGFTSQTVNAPIVIADGLRGFDGVNVKVNGKHLKEVYIAKAIAESDFVVVATHFKLHMRGGIGGAMKNIGVGCVTKTTKFDVHLPSPPEIDLEKCTKCNKCIEICPFDAIVDYEIDLSKCMRCLGCYEVCTDNAIRIGPWLNGDDIAERIVEATKGVVDYVGKDSFAFINFAIDITPHCDCHPYSGVQQVPDIGVFASNDIVAIDNACMDAYIQEEKTSKALIEGDFWEWTSPLRMIEYAEELGLGKRNYRINEIY